MSYKTAEEAIAAAMPEDGDFVGFAGHNCDDPCEGWDGVSRRCQCGNRRVEWCIDEDKDGFIAYAEAY